MQKVVEANSLMKELLFKSSNSLFSANKRKIKAEINSFFKNVQLFECEGEKCFSSENIFISNKYKNGDCSSITDWEWDSNEIYLNKSIIGNRFKDSVNIAVETIESLLFEKFPRNSFYISVCVQYGDLRNINIRIYLNRGAPYANVDIEEYQQPVLNEILNT